MFPTYPCLSGSFLSLCLAQRFVQLANLLPRLLELGAQGHRLFIVAHGGLGHVRLQALVAHQDVFARILHQLLVALHGGLAQSGILLAQAVDDLQLAANEALGGRLSYYRDRYGLEADAVLHLADGRYALVECKLGSREIEDGARHLVSLRELIRQRNESERQMPLRLPDLLIVLTGGELAYTRADGVKVIPLGCLKD